MTSIYRLALRLLPPELRRKHGAEMATMFVRELENARARGRVHVAVAGAAGIWDVVCRSTYELVRMGEIQMGELHMSLPTTRQLLRRHAFSFAIAFVALTIVLLFPFASRQIPSLSARGDSYASIAQVLLLALPFIAAMTIPMAVLLSVLYEFTRLGADGALAAARQVRHGVRRLVVPVLVAAAGITVLAFVVTAEIVPRANERLASVLVGAPTSPGDRSMTIGALREAAKHVEQNVEQGVGSAGRLDASGYEVEIQKKLALPAACLVLAFAGMALAFRIPRGGAALVIVGSLVCFGAYYFLLTTGEMLADRQAVSPFVGMWAANAVILTVAVLAVWQRGFQTQKRLPGF
ncbi:MAG: LptF/LptG family permease [Gemmatimonadaceae bacterium]